MKNDWLSLFGELMEIPLLCGPIFVIAGIIMLKFPPKKINYLYGYRTSKSMKSQENWDFSQIYSAKQLILCGFLLFLSSFINLIFKFNESSRLLLGMLLLFLAVGILFYRCETALSRFEKRNQPN